MFQSAALFHACGGTCVPTPSVSSGSTRLMYVRALTWPLLPWLWASQIFAAAQSDTADAEWAMRKRNQLARPAPGALEPFVRASRRNSFPPAMPFRPLLVDSPTKGSPTSREEVLQRRSKGSEVCPFIQHFHRPSASLTALATVGAGREQISIQTLSSTPKRGCWRLPSMSSFQIVPLPPLLLLAARLHLLQSRAVGWLALSLSATAAGPILLDPRGGAG